MHLSPFTSPHHFWRLCSTYYELRPFTLVRRKFLSYFHFEFRSIETKWFVFSPRTLAPSNGNYKHGYSRVHPGKLGAQWNLFKNCQGSRREYTTSLCRTGLCLSISNHLLLVFPSSPESSWTPFGPFSWSLEKHTLLP